MSDQNSNGAGKSPRKEHKGTPGDREREREALRGKFEPKAESNPAIEAMPVPEGATEIIQTDFEIGQDNIEGKVPFAFDIHNPVFVISAVSVVLFTAITVILSFTTAVAPINGEVQPSGVEEAFTGLLNFMTGTFDWLFLSAGNIFVLLCIFLIFSPYGKVRLGGPEATPDFSMTGWFSMLFAAGMGIGLMFYGVSEPLGHFDAALGGQILGEDGVRTDWAPLGGAEGDEASARRLGMAATIFHWGLHPWAIYAVVALSLALFAYNKGLPLTLRSVFYPLFGEAVWGWPGHIIDILAVLATLFGLATSLGVGAEQAGAGLDFLFGWGSSLNAKIILIIVITLVATMSVVLGVEKGVKRVSEINMVLAIILLIFVVTVGPTMSIITGFFGNLGAYAKEIVPLSNPFGRDDDNFRQGWTAFYWAWWISWSPFVGMFIARVSRGRSVREFLIAVLIVPSIISVFWMTALGGTAVSMTIDGVTAIRDASLELKLFEMLQGLPLTAITSFVGIILVIVFFVTSSDSGSLVIDTISAGGKVNSPVPQRIFWCSIEGLVAVALLTGGGLQALQAMAVSAGLPFTIVLLVACVALLKGLEAERQELA